MRYLTLILKESAIKILVLVQQYIFQKIFWHLFKIKL